MKNVPKITVLMLNTKIYKDALNSQTLDGESVTTPGWETQARVAADLFLRIFASLARSVRKKIQRVWDKEPVKNPIMGQLYTAPVVIFAYRFAEMTTQLGRQAWATNDGNAFWFDADVIVNAPPEVSGFLIAHQLAFTYQLAIHGDRAFEREGFMLEANRLAEAWGYPVLDDRLWENAKQTENPRLRFYADLFARFGYPPKNPQDIQAIERLYIDEGTPELIHLLHRQSPSEFRVSSAIDESNHLPGVRHRILQGRGNMCERCGTKGEQRDLYLHRQAEIERLPELKRDERSIFVLCSVCLREIAWTRFAFGATQTQRVVNFYTTVGRVAGERMLALYKEKLGPLGPDQR